MSKTEMTRQIQTKKGRPLLFDRPLTSTQRYRRFVARQADARLPWGDPKLIDEILAWQFGLRLREPDE